MYIGYPLPYVHMVPPPGSHSAAPLPHPVGVPQNCPKRSFLGPKFCLRSKFERIFEKSQIFFRFRAAAALALFIGICWTPRRGVSPFHRNMLDAAQRR